MNKELPDICESCKQLKELLNRETIGYKRQRLNALYLLQSKQAKTRKQVARLLGVNRDTVGRWLAAYADGGIDEMLRRDFAPGKRPLLSELQLADLKQRLQNPIGFASYGEIAEWIATEYEVEMSYKAVYSLVHDKWHAKPKVPRRSHEKKTPN